MIKDFRVAVRIYNNQIRERREVLGMTPREAATAAGVAYQTWLRYENMQQKPTRPRDDDEGIAEWRPSAAKVASFLRVLPDDLWPESVQSVVSNRFEMDMDGASMLALASGTVDSPQHHALEAEALRERVDAALATLTPREALVLRRRYGLDDGGDGATFREIGKEEACGSERIRQIEQRGLQRLRAPNRAHILADWKPAR